MSTSISATEIGLPDNAKLKLGTGEDLEIYHDGTNTYLDNNTGQFNIDAASGNAIRFLVNGSYQCQVYTSGIDLPDNKKLRLGDSEDLQIYHNGTNSIISSDTGDLILGAGNGSSVKLQPEGGEDGLTVNQNGSVELYHDNSKKFETYANGVRAANNGHIKLASDSGKFFMGAGDDAELFYDGTNLTLNGDGTNATFLRAKSGENSIKLIPDE